MIHFSIQHKTEYVIKKGLGGIMVWELTLDKQKDGLLDVIDKTIKNAISKKVSH
ncbi:MAG: hypothetical protein WDO71_25695 [Bacteroidota bacterium]